MYQLKYIGQLQIKTRTRYAFYIEMPEMRHFVLIINACQIAENIG